MLRKHIAFGLMFVVGTTIACSHGEEQTPADATALDALIIRADQALYAAKHAGRDRVKVAA